MANKIKGINIKIGVDTTRLDTALKGIESAGKKATSELGEVNRSLKNNNDSVVLWKQKQELLTTAVEESRKKLDFLREAQEQIKRQFENGEIDGGQYRAFSREIENAERQTRDFENQLQQANQRVEELGNGLEESGQQAENSANGGYTVLGNVFANVITRGIEIAGTALKNFTQDVVTTGMEYESAISNVTAISGAMSEEVELLQAKAEEMGATTKFTATESAEAMGYMAMAGWKVNDMVSGLDGIMDLSAASGESLASVSDIVTDALTAFGLTAGDSAHFADVLAAASSNANTNVAMMGETFKYAAPVAGALGFSIEDTAEAIGLMANSGIKASQAGTSLRTIMTNLSHDMTIYGEAFRSATNAEGAYTVATTNADGTMRNFGDILADLRTGWEQLTEAEQASNASMETVAGKHAMSGFLALMNATPADVDKLSTAIENADGAAQGMASTMLDNLQGDKTLLDSAVDGMKIAISKELNPALRDVTQWATKQIPKVQAVIEPMFKIAINGVKSLTDGLEKIKPVLSAVKPLIAVVFADKAISLFTKTLMPKAISLLGKIPTLLIKPIDLLGKLPLMIDSLPAKISKIPTALAGVGNSFKALWSVIAANPLAATGIALTGVAFAVKDHINNIEIEKTELEKLIEKHNEELQLLADKKQAIRDLDDAFYENVDGIQNQTDRTKDLWKELDKLADKSGNVQQKDKERAEYLLGELNEALGTEYTMTGNQIENYKNLSAEIDNVIAKKQAEMMLDAYLANSTEMTKQRIEARTDYENADKDYQEQQKALEKAERQFRIFKEKMMNGSKISVEDYIAGNFADNEISTEEGLKLAQSVITARENLQAADNARTQAKRNYEATSEYFEKLDDLQEAYSLGQYDRMADIIYREQELTSTTLDESATDAEQRLQVYNDTLLKVLSNFKLAVEDMTQTSVDEMEEELSELVQAGIVAGKTPEEIWANFGDDIDQFQEKGLDISPLITPFIESGLEPSKAFDDWKETFRTQYENGGDMDSVIKWLDNSRYYRSIPYVFGSNDEYMKYMKEQSGKGLDISSLLEFGAKSPLAESEDFVKYFKSNVAKNLEKGWDVGNLLEVGNNNGIDLSEEFGKNFGTQMDILYKNGVDLTTFIQWAETNGKTVAEVFGENFQTELTEYLKINRLKDIDSIKENHFVQFFSGKNTLSDRLIKAFADGKDVSELVRKAEKQGLEVGDVFGDNYTDVIQQQIDNGWSITELLEWGETSGLKIGDMLGKNYTTEMQSIVDKGFTIISLLEWAESAGIKTGEVFGTKMQETVDKYMKYMKIQNEISELHSGSFVSGHLSNILGKLPLMANGGFLRNGQAVVAEAGPELLEIVNGGARVTPLSENSRNIATNQGQKIFYSNYTINATISDGYDVSRLAEELETERRRLERGMGK